MKEVLTTKGNPFTIGRKAFRPGGWPGRNRIAGMEGAERIGEPFPAGMKEEKADDQG